MKILKWVMGGFLILLVIMWLLFVMAGCAQIEPLPDVPKEVRIPVPVPCVEPGQIPAATFITAAELLALPDAPFVYALARDRLDRSNHIARLEAILQGCTTIGEKP